MKRLGFEGVQNRRDSILTRFIFEEIGFCGYSEKTIFNFDEIHFEGLEAKEI